MTTTALTMLDEGFPRDRLALLLEHFSAIEDEREPWRVLYPLSEVLLVVVCGTIAACDDFDDIVAWGEHHLDFLRKFMPFHHGIPCERWLRILLNRIDPILFKRCFESWVAATWPDRPEFIAIDGKTVAYGADYLLALKGNQPTLEADVTEYFRTAPKGEVVTKTTVEKGHGRIETRTYTASQNVDWITSARSYPGQPRCSGIKTILKVEERAEHSDRTTFDTRFFISSAALDIERLANGTRGHWGVESMHWLDRKSTR